VYLLGDCRPLFASYFLIQKSSKDSEFGRYECDYFSGIFRLCLEYSLCGFSELAQYCLIYIWRHGFFILWVVIQCYLTYFAFLLILLLTQFHFWPLCPFNGAPFLFCFFLFKHFLYQAFKAHLVFCLSQP